ncbi:MAG: prepilin-type N-terminal cleavage/methylation domain-containing protein [Defluviitaleaceae bacterium]|nr:prepilin-type N-terminal cleavage/methylation domain-containing protein [Defluviitaleaceae bacterium]
MQNKKKAGITLIEATVALAVLLILAAAVAPSVADADRRALAYASQCIQADIRLAQRLAVAEGRTHHIGFNHYENYYTVYTSPPYKEIERVYLPNGVMIRSAENFYYLPRGTASKAQTIRLGKGRFIQDLTVLVGSGRVRAGSITSIP